MAVVNDISLLKQAIFKEVRRQALDFESLDDIEMNKLFFHRPDTLRLSLKGFMEIKAIFTAYSFALPEELKNKHRIGMSKMTYPYFITKRRLILFSEMDASVIKLSGGIEKFLESCSAID